jgi:cell wall-associated NlpC family hydrolase
VRKRGLATLALLSLLGLIIAGCGQLQAVSTSPSSNQAAVRGDGAAAPSLHAHPQAVEPVAGAASPSAAPSAAPTEVSVGPSRGRTLPQPLSNAEIRQQLSQSGMTASTNQATLSPGGLAVAPIDAPAAVQAVIAAGNEIARLPYRYGGGHLTYEDTAYDCSGSISYVFAAAHLLKQTVVSGQLENWGDPGPGKWITVFANAGHTFMYVAGLRFDTVALAETGSRWSDAPADEPDLSTFSVRHPVGL